jgi:ribosomal protein L11 methyltransferase
MPQLALWLALEDLDAEKVEDACFAAGALAVTFRDMRDDPVWEPAPGEFRLWPHSAVQALFPIEAGSLETVVSVATSLGIEPARINITTLEDRVWEREWLKDFRPMRFGKRLWIAPHGSVVPDADAAVVRLDPGLAFGTGTHPTTAMCLEWLDANLAVGATVIDYGCGSGVLALGATRLGATSAHAFDIDPQALIATRDNAAANDLQALITCVDSADALPSTTDVLLANILAEPLCQLAPRFATHVRAGGVAVLAGLLDAQASEVTAAYAPWFDTAAFASRDGWTALAARRH